MIDPNFCPRWKCFIKGISTTHVIITILPASEKDVQVFMYPSCTEDLFVSSNPQGNYETGVFNLDLNEKQSNSSSYAGDGNVANSNEFIANITSKIEEQRNFQDCERNLIIPIYVYDCSLALLIDTLTDKLKIPYNKDIFQDRSYIQNWSSRL